MISAFDSAFGPSLQAAKAARAGGTTAWFGYLGGPGVYHQWTPAEWSVLRQAGLTPGALWVPTYGLAEDPFAAADAAVAIADSLGLYGTIMLDTEQAMHDVAGPGRVATFVDQFVQTVNQHPNRQCAVYTGAHYAPASAPTFDPLWGATVYPVELQAIQYGPAVRYGMSVDVDLCHPTFPLASWTPPPPPTPTPVPAPTPLLEDNMLYLITATGRGYAMTNGLQKRVITTAADGSAYGPLKLPVVTVSVGEFDSYPSA